MKLNREQQLRLEEIINKFPEIKVVADRLNQAGVSWGIAAGAAKYVYIGGGELDDVDVWVAAEDKLTVEEVLGQEWQGQFSERHQAENIAFEGLDLFASCRIIKGEEILIDYRWTKAVDDHLLVEEIEGTHYSVIAPEDVVALKMVNPRDEDREDVLALEQMGLDKEYLRNRLAECGVTIILNKLPCLDTGSLL